MYPLGAKETSPRAKEQGTETPSLTAAAVPRSHHLQAQSTELTPVLLLVSWYLLEHTEREIDKNCMEYVAVKVESAHQ